MVYSRFCATKCVVKMGGDGLAAAGIARQDAIPAHIALHAVDMELFVQLLHKIVSFKSGSTRERRRIRKQFV